MSIRFLAYSDVTLTNSPDDRTAVSAWNPIPAAKHSIDFSMQIRAALRGGFFAADSAKSALGFLAKNYFSSVNPTFNVT
jgi:hypothetical protein